MRRMKSHLFPSPSVALCSLALARSLARYYIIITRAHTQKIMKKSFRSCKLMSREWWWLIFSGRQDILPCDRGSMNSIYILSISLTDMKIYWIGSEIRIRISREVQKGRNHQKNKWRFLIHRSHYHPAKRRACVYNDIYDIIYDEVNFYKGVKKIAPSSPAGCISNRKDRIQ